MTLQLADRPASAPLSQRARPSRRQAQHYYGRSLWRPESLRQEAEPFGLRIARTDELPATHKLAESIMQMRLAPLWALASAHAHTGASAWVFDNPHSDDAEDVSLTGLFLILPLNWYGEAALRAQRFNFSGPRLDELCAPGDEISALYFWLTAGSDGRARRNVMRTILAWLGGSCSRLRVYARAASEDGARALAGLQFQPLSSDSPSLFFRDQHR